MTKVAILLALSGCWHFTAPEDPAPPPSRPAPRAPRRRPAPNTDAAVPDAAPPASPLASGSPGPARPAPPAHAVPFASPPCVNGRVISLTVLGGPQQDIRLVVAAGARRGVTPSWTATLLIPAQPPGRITDVQPAITRLVVSGVTPDLIQVNPIVALCP